VLEITPVPEKNKRLPGELTFTALLLLGSLFLLAQAYGISGFESITSAGMFPMLSALVMVLTAAWVVMRTRQSQPAAAKDGESLPKAFARLITPAVFIGFTLTILAFMVLLPKLGFVVSAYAFLLASMRLLGSARWGFNAALSAASLAVVYLIFQTVFSVILPKGTWLAGVWA
jgi:putative tricarboxylic transport membrane protein